MSTTEETFDQFATQLAQRSKMISGDEHLENCSFTITHLGCGCTSCSHNLPVISLEGRTGNGERFEMFAHKYDLDILLMEAMAFSEKGKLAETSSPISFYDEEKAKAFLI